MKLSIQAFKVGLKLNDEIRFKNKIGFFKTSMNL